MTTKCHALDYKMEKAGNAGKPGNRKKVYTDVGPCSLGDVVKWYSHLHKPIYPLSILPDTGFTLVWSYTLFIQTN